MSKFSNITSSIAPNTVWQTRGRNI